MTTKTFLILIVLLSGLLRFYRLDVYPAVNADEASNAYDAYSLLVNGRDQHGNSWPVNFQSFNDYKPGLYVYLSLPFIKVMGLNSWALRIPGALLGTLSVLVMFYFVRLLFKNTKLALVSSFFLGISPWHLHFSRGGWEVNIATFFILVGLTSFLQAQQNISYRRKMLFLVISGANLVLALYAYHATRILVPLLVIGLVLFFYDQILANIKIYLVALIISIVLSVPLLLNLTNPGALSRAAGVGLFADKGPISRINEQRGEHVNLNDLDTKLMHNKVVNYGLAFLNNWTTHYGGEFLFLSGDSIERNKVPETGQMYLFDIIFLLFCALVYFRNIDRNKKFIFFWLLVAPIASALTFQSPNALRSQNMVIPLVILSAYGAVYAFELFNRYKLSSLSLVCLVLIIWNFGRYIDMYWNYMSKAYPYSSQYGVEEMISYINEVEHKYENIFITGRYDQPYILYLYYKKYPPRDFQGRHTLTSKDEYGFSSVLQVGNVHFGPIDIEHIKRTYPKSLIIAAPEEIPDTENIVKKIYGTNGVEYFDIVPN